MRVLIENGKVCIPKEIIKKVNLPENGECEVEVSKDGLKILKLQDIPLGMIKILQEPPVERSIVDMMKDEVVEDV